MEEVEVWTEDYKCNGDRPWIGHIYSIAFTFVRLFFPF